MTHAKGDFGTPKTMDPHVFLVRVPSAGDADVTIVEDFGLQGGHDDQERVERCQLARGTWNAIREPVRRILNERLKQQRLEPGTWRIGDNKIERLLGKELCVLAWAVEVAPMEQIPNAIRSWSTLRPEERWWLFSMAAATSGTIEDVDVGWRKAIRVALAEAPGEPAAVRRARPGKPAESEVAAQITLFLERAADE